MSEAVGRAHLSTENTYQLNSPLGLDLSLATLPPKNALKLGLSGALRGSLLRARFSTQL